MALADLKFMLIRALVTDRLFVNGARLHVAVTCWRANHTARAAAVKVELLLLFFFTWATFLRGSSKPLKCSPHIFRVSVVTLWSASHMGRWSLNSCCLTLSGGSFFILNDITTDDELNLVNFQEGEELSFLSKG